MFSLIKNELLKIFRKKSTYVMFVIIFILVLLTNIIYKTNLDESGEFKQDIHNYLKEEIDKLNNLDITNIENKKEELSTRKNIMKYEIYEKYGVNSWQAYITDTKLLNIIDGIIESEYGNRKNPDDLDYFLKEYKFIIEKFDSDDWRYFVNEQIKDLEQKREEINASHSDNDLLYKSEELEYMKFLYTIDLKIENYRLENDVSYANTYVNDALLNYSIALKEIKNNNEKEELFKYYNNLSTMHINKYILDNKINANKVNDTRGILINLFMEYEVFVIIFIVMISANVITSEFNKGTIKQLLITPYSRKYIFLSKYITSLLMIIIIIFILVLMQLLVGSLIFGTSSLSVPVVVYSFNLQKIKTYNIFFYLLIEILAKLPMFILIMTIVFFVSNITLNGAISIILGILIYLTDSIINSLAISIKVINYLVFPHWDFTKYLFGMISQNKFINVNVSMLTCLIYFIILFVSSFIVFNKKDIKNM